MNAILKRAFYGTVLSALVIACAKPLAPIDITEPTGDEELVPVSFTTGTGPDTKLVDILTDNEKNITRWALVVFDDESGWNTYGTASGNSAISLRLRGGRSYTGYAIVNYPTSGTGSFTPSPFSSFSEFKARLATLEGCTPSSLLMYGSLTFTPTVTTQASEAVSTEPTPEEKTIHVKRILSRVDVKKIIVDFSGKPTLSGKTFTLRHIYLSNLYRNTTYISDLSYAGLSNTRSAWYNSGGWHRGEGGIASIDVITSDRDIDSVISAGSPYVRNHSFYAIPNPTPESSDDRQMGLWGKRCTRLVIEATIDTDTYYYAITIPSMARNSIYEFQSITIKGKGSNDPEVLDMDPSDLIVDFSVSRDGWDMAGEITENS